MTIPPESLQIGKCYVTQNGSVRRVTSTDSDGEVRYRERVGVEPWPTGVRKRRRHDFATEALREVPCDWTPEAFH